MSIRIASSPHISFAIRRIHQATSLMTSTCFSEKSRPGIWLYPQATRHVWKTPSLFILRTHLHSMQCHPAGTWAHLTLCQMPNLSCHEIRCVWMYATFHTAQGLGGQMLHKSVLGSTKWWCSPSPPTCFSITLEAV